jgi:class 3 adenylate cyclase/tetratricopeptide (TPR) repeat protein
MTGKPWAGGELSERAGELRRLTIMFCDLVGSTELSARQEPEAYRELMKAYHATCRDVIESRFEGHIVQLKGDGHLSTFGFPVAHENDTERAVRAGLALVQAVRELSRATHVAADESLDVRVAVHHGPVYLDLHEDDVYGLAANVGARLHTLADPGAVVVSEEVRELVQDRFEIEAGDPQVVKGVPEPLRPFRIIGERRVPGRRAWSTPLVEREGELERLGQAWARVVAGSADRATGVLVRGDAGLGKSRLVAALVDEAAAADSRVVGLHGSPFHLDAGFHPVRRLIESRCRLAEDATEAERLDRLTQEIADLDLDRSETVALLAPVLDIDPSAGYAPAASEGRKLEEQVAQAVLAYVLACTQGQPAIIVAEDLHWFDSATRALLEALLRNGPKSLLVVATSRDPEPGRWATIELAPLTPAGRLALIDALEEDLTEQERLALASRSDGIPLYVEELVRAGAVHHPTSAGEAAPVPGSVPEALYEPLVARLYSTPAALPVAATAAAVGQEVDRSLLAQTISIAGEELDWALRALVEASVLEPVDDRSARYRFRHELLREVAYELQPPSWRRKVHNRLCDLLTRDQPSDWYVLASHFERAERDYEAAVAYQHTAEWARRRGALSEARAHLSRAIDLVVPLTDDPERDHREVELRLRRGFLAMSAEGAASAEASADFDRCLELAAADPGGDDMFSTLISVWAYDLSRAELDRARQVLVTLRAALAGERLWFRPQNLAGFGMLDWFGGRFEDALATLEAATRDLTEMSSEADVDAVWFVPNDPAAAMHVHLALARFMTADVLGAGRSLALAGEVAEARDFPQGPWSAAYANWLGSWMWIEAGRLEEAGAALADLQASSDRHGFDNWALIGATQAAVLEAATALRSGTADAPELSEHADAIGAYIEYWQMVELRVFLPFYLTTTGALLAAAGDPDAARERYQESLRLAEETGMRFYDAETTRRLAHLASERGEVVATLRSALDLARSQAARPFELRIALDLHALLGDDARPTLERAVLAYGQGPTTTDIEEARSRVLTPG